MEFGGYSRRAEQGRGRKSRPEQDKQKGQTVLLEGTKGRADNATGSHHFIPGIGYLDQGSRSSFRLVGRTLEACFGSSPLTASAPRRSGNLGLQRGGYAKRCNTKPAIGCSHLGPLVRSTKYYVVYSVAGTLPMSRPSILAFLHSWRFPRGHRRFRSLHDSASVQEREETCDVFHKTQSWDSHLPPDRQAMCTCPAS